MLCLSVALLKYSDTHLQSYPHTSNTIHRPIHRQTERKREREREGGVILHIVCSYMLYKCFMVSDEVNEIPSWEKKEETRHNKKRKTMMSATVGSYLKKWIYVYCNELTFINVTEQMKL